MTIATQSPLLFMYGMTSYECVKRAKVVMKPNASFGHFDKAARFCGLAE